jgi:hypothetical protein
MRIGLPATLLLLSLGAAPAAAQPAVEEVGASIWHTVPFFSGFGFREALSLTADTSASPWLRLRGGLRASSAANIDGTVLRQPQLQVLGTFLEFAPSFSVLAGGDVGVARFQGGLGVAYFLRYAQVEDAAVGTQVVPGGAFGTVKSIGLTFDPGVDAVGEAAFAIPLGFRLVVGLGLSLANARLIIQPREDPNLEVAVPELFFTASLQVGIRWSPRGAPPPPPARGPGPKP